MSTQEKKSLRRRRSSLSSRLLSLPDSSEREDLHPAVLSDNHQRRRSLKSQPVLDNTGHLFRHPDIPILSIDEIFNEVLVTNSIGYLKKCRRMSDEVTKMSLLEMKQAWASSRFFTNNPINKREQKSPSSSHSVVFQLPGEVELLEKSAKRIEDEKSFVDDETNEKEENSSERFINRKTETLDNLTRSSFN